MFEYFAPFLKGVQVERHCTLFGDSDFLRFEVTIKFVVINGFSSHFLGIKQRLASANTNISRFGTGPRFPIHIIGGHRVLVDRGHLFDNSFDLANNSFGLKFVGWFRLQGDFVIQIGIIVL